jgi:hypothetical protein
VGQVTREAPEQVIHHLVGQEDAAAVCIAAQNRAALGFAQVLQREDMAPGQPRAEVLAQRQVHRRKPACRSPLHSGVHRLDEQRKGLLLQFRIEPLALVQHHQ